MGLGLFHFSDNSNKQKHLTFFERRDIIPFSEKNSTLINEGITKKTITTPNPNPFRFKVVQEKVVNEKSILLVWYPDCETFDGYKLLLLKGKYIPSETLDPHFLSSEHIILARFEPNKKGWELAQLCAKNKSKK